MLLSKFVKKYFYKKSNPIRNISRTEIINYLIKTKSYKKCLEIDVRNPKINFDKIKINYKDGVDPNWNGTTWKSWVKLRCSRSDLNMFVIDTDEGCGIIYYGSQNIWLKDPISSCINYSYLDKNRKKLLNLISINDFFSKIK